MKSLIFTHRGLEPSNKESYPESSYEQFENHIKRGYGIEFDVCFAKDGVVILHDLNLSRITNGKDNRLISEVTLNELKTLKYTSKNGKQGSIPNLKQVLELVKEGSAEIHALHLKGIYQEKEKIDLILSEIQKIPQIIQKILIFDLKPEFAKYVKSKIPELKTAPSVAHEYDIQRYNKVVKETLISINEAIEYKKKGIYDWVWLDEWDTLDEMGGKKFYTKENFEKLRKAGYKIALVTPELHGTSPGLYGGESHKDAKNKEVLFNRIKEILFLNPDAICTDYPKECSNFN